MPNKIPKFQYPAGPLVNSGAQDAKKFIDGFNLNFLPKKSITSVLPYNPIVPLKANLQGFNYDTKKLEVDKLLSKTGSSGVNPASLSTGFNIGSMGLDLIGSIAKPLDHESGASKALEVGSKVAGMIPGPWGQGISAGLKAVKLLDQLAGKKAKSQITQGETATGYNLDFNANASTSYGGLFGNKKRKEANKLTASQDISNIKKLDVSKTAEKELLAAQNATQNILSKNTQKLLGNTSVNVLSAKQGDKLLFSKIQKNVTKKLEKGGSVNVIPSGALHRELNHLDGDHTKKGIPVIMEEEGGKITQQAEIEREEIIFNLGLTKQLEELLKKFNDGDDNAAIEAGKLLTTEILENTIDNTGILNKIE